VESFASSECLILSNHCLILVKDNLIDCGIKPFKVLNGWFDDGGLKEIVMEAWRSQNVEGEEHMCLKRN